MYRSNFCALSLDLFSDAMASWLLNLNQIQTVGNLSNYAFRVALSRHSVNTTEYLLGGVFVLTSTQQPSSVRNMMMNYSYHGLCLLLTKNMETVKKGNSQRNFSITLAHKALRGRVWQCHHPQPFLNTYFAVLSTEKVRKLGIFLCYHH